MRLITGHLRPDLGSVEVLGRDAWSAAAKRHIGYCPEVDSFYEEMSGRQFVEAMARLGGYAAAEARRRTGAALERVGMAGRAERRLRGYSKGMRQRVKLAQALLHDPELLVLDEPLSGIDPVGRAEFIALFRELAEQGKCLLVVQPRAGRAAKTDRSRRRHGARPDRRRRLGGPDPRPPRRPSAHRPPGRGARRGRERQGPPARTGRAPCCVCRTWSAWNCWTTSRARKASAGCWCGPQPAGVLPGPDPAGAGGVVRGTPAANAGRVGARRCWAICSAGGRR